MRSSSKASNPIFRPLIGSQEPTPEVLVPVIKLTMLLVNIIITKTRKISDSTAANPICPGDLHDSGGRAGFVTKPYKHYKVQILDSELVLGSVQ